MVAGCPITKCDLHLEARERRTLPKPSVIVNLLEALLAVIVGNMAYFFLAPSLHLPRHRPFQLDWGLIVDFWFCVVAYGVIRTARRWK
jgi:hypothetical protein